MNVTTNNHRRTLVTYWELTVTESEEFDYVTDEDDRYVPRFVRAYGNVYDTHDVQRISVAPRHEPFGFNVAADSPLASWHGIATESAFSGTVFRFINDEDGADDAVIVGSAYSS